MKITIHKGSHEIGGACMEITTSKKLWVDFGQPLTNETPSIAVFPDALLLTHSHQDHYGLIDKLPTEIPIYAGSITKNLIQALRPFLREKSYSNNFQAFEAWKPFAINDINVTPYLVDHSAPEAFAFLLEAYNKRVFVSGDFRNGGAKKKVFENLCNNPPSDIDVLFVEGTTIQRDNPTYPDETAVEEAMFSLFREQKNLSLVFGAGQNIDRIVGVYRACKRSDKHLLINPYVAYMLHIIGEKSARLPQWTWGDIFIVDPNGGYSNLLRENGLGDFADQLQSKLIGNKVFRNPSKYVQYSKPSKSFIETLIRQHQHPVNLIYSMWEGYLKEEKTAYIIEIKGMDNVNFHSIHTSGHAHKDDLLTLVRALKPKKIIPIHTDNPDKVKEFLDSNGVLGVEVWNDGEAKEI